MPTDIAVRTGQLFQPQVAHPMTATDHIEVILARPGVAPKKFRVPQGTTIQNLATEVGATLEKQKIFVNEREVGVDHVLTNKSVTFLVPQPKNA